MDINDKLAENIMKIIKISGFQITFPGDPSVGIPNSFWSIDGDFYFDNQEELEIMREQLRSAWESYCGENCKVLTLNEYYALMNEKE